MKLIASLFTILSILTSCNQEQPKSADPVVVSTTPVLDHFVRRNLHGIPSVQSKIAIRTQGTCLHEHAISMEEIRSLCNAALIVANGLEFEPFLEQALKQCPHVPVFYAFENCQPMELQEQHHHAMEKSHSPDYDPHAWFGAVQMNCMLTNLGKTLATVDSVHKSKILSNTDTIRTHVESFWDSLKTQYASLRGTNVVAFHSAYNYLLQEFGMKVIANVSEESENATPSAQESAQLIQTIRQNNIQLLLAGEMELPEIAYMIAKESGARLVPMITMLEPMDSSDAFAYEHILAENLRRIRP